MNALSLGLYGLAAVHLAAGVPALLAPELVRDRLPPRYADAVGERQEWRGFGAGLTSIGLSLFAIAGALAA